MRGELLEALSEQIGVFISDLRNPKYRVPAMRRLGQLPPEQYSLLEWEYCLSYLLDQKLRIHSYQELSEFLEGQNVGV